MTIGEFKEVVQMMDDRTQILVEGGGDRFTIVGLVRGGWEYTFGSVVFKVTEAVEVGKGGQTGLEG